MRAKNESTDKKVVIAAFELINRGKYEKAITVLENAKSPDSIIVLQYLWLAYYKIKNYPLAFWVLNKIASKKELSKYDQEWVTHHFGKLLRRIGNTEKAEVIFRKLVAQYPERIPGIIELACTLEDKGQPDEAENYFFLAEHLMRSQELKK